MITYYLFETFWFSYIINRTSKVLQTLLLIFLYTFQSVLLKLKSMIKLTPFIYFEHNIYNVFESNLKKKLCRSPVDPKYGCRPIVVSVACVSLISQRFQNVHRGSS